MNLLSKHRSRVKKAIYAFDTIMHLIFSRRIKGGTNVTIFFLYPRHDRLINLQEQQLLRFLKVQVTDFQIRSMIKQCKCHSHSIQIRNRPKPIFFFLVYSQTFTHCSSRWLYKALLFNSCNT
jgi:hypothetical protein